MFSNLKIRQLHQILKCGWVLLLLILLSGCSRNKDLPKPAKVTQIQFKENSITLDVGKSTALKVLHTPAELNAPMYEWFVLNPDVAKVENGTLQGLSMGETVLVVTAKGLDLTARIRISVLPVPPKALQLSAEKTYLTPGEETQITYTIDPQDVTDANQLEIEWLSSDETVCQVSAGKVLAVGTGAADVVAKIKGTAITGMLRIQVAPVPVERIILSKSDLALVVGQDHNIEATVQPEQANDKSFRWNSSNLGVATVDQHGKVMAKAKGTAIIWAISVAQPRVQAACQVVVLEPQDMVYTQVTATGRVSVNGYVSANLSGLIENGYSSMIQLISFEVMSHSGEVVFGDYQRTVVSPSIQHRHTTVIKSVFRPYVKYVFELNGRRYERREEIL